MPDNEDSTDKRIEALEQTVLRLEQEVHELKYAMQMKQTEDAPVQDKPVIEENNIEENMQPSFTEKLNQQMRAEMKQREKAKVIKAEMKQSEKEKVKKAPTSPIQKEKVHTVKTETAPKKPSTPSMEDLISTWLPRVFMVILILGVLWGLKISMDYGWISYQVRILLGYAATAGIFYISYRQLKKQNKIFGITLMSGVIVIGILVTAAAYYLYGILNYPAALLISIIYIGLGLYMSKWSNSESLTIFSGFAGFLLPFLISGETVSTWPFCFYILILFMALFYIAISSKHKISYYVTFVFFQLTLFLFYMYAYPNIDEKAVIITVFMQHILVLATYLLQTDKEKFLNESIIYSNVVIILAWIKILEDYEQTIVYGLFALAYLVLAIYGYSKKKLHLQSIFSAVTIFATSAYILSFDSQTIETKLLLLLINGTVGLWIGFYFKTLRTIIISSLIYGITAIVIIFNVELIYWLSIEQAMWFVLILSLIFVFYLLYKFGLKYFKIDVNMINRSLILGQLIALVYIFRLTNLTLETITVGFVDWSIWHHTYFLVMLTAVLITFMAYRFKNGLALTYAATIEFLWLGIIGLTLTMKSYNGLLGTFYVNLFIEIFYLACLVGLFLLIYHKKYPGKHLLVEYIQSFAIAVQATAFIYFTKWYFNITDIYYWETDYIYIIHTIWMFLFAFLSITLGTKQKWDIVRYLGLGLIGVCLIKLFFTDLVSISIVIRAVLFMIVGAVGLIYTRTLQKH